MEMFHQWTTNRLYVYMDACFFSSTLLNRKCFGFWEMNSWLPDINSIVVTGQRLAQVQLHGVLSTGHASKLFIVIGSNNKIERAITQRIMK